MVTISMYVRGGGGLPKTDSHHTQGLKKQQGLASDLLLQLLKGVVPLGCRVWGLGFRV